MKRIIALIMFILTVLGCAACQPTPKEPVVISKNDGKLEAGIYGTPAPLGKYTAPDTWHEEIDTSKSDDKHLKIVVDAAVSVPDTESYPVYRVSPHTLTDDDAREFIKAVFGTEELWYVDNPRTKDVVMQDILHYQSLIEKVEAEYKKTGDEEYKLEAKTHEKRVEELRKEYASAPEKLDKKTVDIELKRVNYGGSYVWELNGYSEDFVSDVFFQRSETYSSFLTSYYGFNRLHVWDNVTDRSSMIALSRYVLHGKANGAKKSYDKALKEADAYIHDTLGYTDFVMSTPFVESYVPQGMTEYELVASEMSTSDFPQRYGFLYVKSVNNIPVCYYEKGNPDAKEPEKNASPMWEQSYISIVIDDEGVYSVMASSTFDIGEKLTENAALLPFEQIQKVFREYAPLCSEYNTFHLAEESAGSENLDRQKYVYDDVTLTVKDVRLGYLRSKEKGGDLTQGILIPAWFFYGEQDTSYYKRQSDVGKEDKLIHQDFPGDIGRCFMCINAIDGSVVDMRYGY